MLVFWTFFCIFSLVLDPADLDQSTPLTCFTPPPNALGGVFATRVGSRGIWPIKRQGLDTPPENATAGTWKMMGFSPSSESPLPRPPPPPFLGENHVWALGGLFFSRQKLIR